MKSKINETGESIEKLINHLEQKILKMNHLMNKDDKIFKELTNLYNNLIIPWYDNYMFNKTEIDKKEETEMVNIILDALNKIDIFIKNQTI